MRRALLLVFFFCAAAPDWAAPPAAPQPLLAAGLGVRPQNAARIIGEEEPNLRERCERRVRLRP